MILVTGGAGYIGSHVVLNLLAQKETVIIFDNLSTGSLATIEVLKTAGTLIFIKGDLTDLEQIKRVFEKYPITAVLHFASFIEVGESVVNPEKYYRNNLLGGMNLFSAMLAAKVDKIVFSSTAATYGEPRSNPIDEQHPQCPINSYGYSKWMLETILRNYSQAYGLKSVILRYFNVIGADALGRVGENHKPETHLVPNLLEAALFHQTFQLYGNDYPTRDQTCIRDYIDVEDLAEAHFLALRYLFKEKKSAIFNLGTQTGYSVKEIIEQVELVTKNKILLEIKGRRRGDPAVLVAANRLARTQLGWSPKRSLFESIEHAKNWLMKQRGKVAF